MHMDRVVFPAKDKVTVAQRQLDDEPGPGQVLIELCYSTISPGTELAFLQVLPNTSNEFPMEPGYSASGRVRRAGADAAFAVDDAVAAYAPHGSMALVDAAWCTRLPDGVDLREASGFRLASIAIQGVRKGQVQLGERVAVLGLGVIGNLAGQLARAAGATRVAGIDPVNWRREIARDCEFDVVAQSAEALSDDGPWDVVIEATGVPAVANTAFDLARRMGRVVLLGTSRGPTESVDFCNAIHRRGLTVLGAHDSVRAKCDDGGALWTHTSDHRTVVELLANKRLKIAPLLSDTMPGREAEAAYRRLTSRDEPLMTITLDWTDGAA